MAGLTENQHLIDRYVRHFRYAVMVTLLIVLTLTRCEGVSHNTHIECEECKSNYDSLLKRDIYYDLETPAKYPDGYRGLLKFVLNNLKIKDYERDIGRIDVKFVIGTNGEVLKTDFLGDVPYSLRTKVIRLFEDETFLSGKCGIYVVASVVEYHIVW